MANLYELTQEQLALYEMMQTEDAVDMETGELNPELAKALEINEGNLKDKILATGIVIKQLTADAKMLKEEEERIAERRKRAENNAERLKANLSNSMLALGMDKFADAKLAISFRTSTSVEVFNEKYLPEQYFTEKVTRVPSKKEIGEALKAGETVAGAQLVVKRNIQIK